MLSCFKIFLKINKDRKMILNELKISTIDLIIITLLIHKNSKMRGITKNCRKYPKNLTIFFDTEFFISLYLIKKIRNDLYIYYVGPRKHCDIS